MSPSDGREPNAYLNVSIILIQFLDNMGFLVINPRSTLKMNVNKMPLCGGGELNRVSPLKRVAVTGSSHLGLIKIENLFEINVIFLTNSELNLPNQ